MRPIFFVRRAQSTQNGAVNPSNSPHGPPHPESKSLILNGIAATFGG